MDVPENGREGGGAGGEGNSGGDGTNSGGATEPNGTEAKGEATPAESEGGEMNVCGICRDELTHDVPTVTLPCHHCFCANCLWRWAEQSLTCPMCRKSILPA